MNNIKIGLMAAALAAFAGTATAGDFPKGSVDYVIPFGPGGESDITARLQQPYFEKLYGEQLVVSYQPGGGGAFLCACLVALALVAGRLLVDQQAARITRAEPDR